MAVIFHDAYQPYYEAYVLLGNLMNRTTPEPFREQLIKAGLEHEAALLLDDILSLYQTAADRFEPFDPKLVNLFKGWRENETAMTSSDILTYAYLPDRLNHMREQMEALGDDQRKRQIFWGIATALGEGDLSRFNGGSSLVQLLEHAGLNDNWKYHILWLYHCAAEAAQLLQNALNDMVEAIGEALETFQRHAVETIAQLKEIPNLPEYVQQETGILLPQEGNVHVYPSAILLGAAHVRNQEGAPPRPEVLIWGSRFLDARRLSKATQALPTSQGDVLRMVSEKAKFEILLALRRQTSNSGELAELLNLKPTTVSHHLNELLKNGLVTVESRQNRSYYACNAARVKEVLREAEGLF